ncbi:MAG: hypothetical protein M3349_09565 [Actinomycetota bacterium]|nr:hypothetical protein [Actinomycetota bacterium]
MGGESNRDEARQLQLTVEDLEISQQIQEEVLTAYHVRTMGFEQTMAVKMFRGGTGRAWVKNQQQTWLPTTT